MSGGGGRGEFGFGSLPLETTRRNDSLNPIKSDTFLGVSAFMRLFSLSSTLRNFFLSNLRYLLLYLNIYFFIYLKNDIICTCLFKKQYYSLAKAFFVFLSLLSMFFSLINGCTHDFFHLIYFSCLKKKKKQYYLH